MTDEKKIEPVVSPSEVQPLPGSPESKPAEPGEAPEWTQYRDSHSEDEDE